MFFIEKNNQKSKTHSSLSLEDINPSDIDFDKPLFYDGLGLDSIDSLELSMALSSQYGFQLKGFIFKQ
jgi:acyl carrier protein